MKLYYKPGVCSLAAHIVLRELGLPFDMEAVDLATRKTASGGDYRRVNPLGYVPALVLDDGTVLTENAAILQYLADSKPAAGLVPAAGTMDRYRLIAWLSFISSEVHKQFSPFFNPRTPAEWKEILLARLKARFEYLARHFEHNAYLMGDKFTIADSYLYVVLRWADRFQVDLSPWPALTQYLTRIAARPAVQAALKAEGLTGNPA
jgi:glutathione S-transferase